MDLKAAKAVAEQFTWSGRERKALIHSNLPAEPVPKMPADRRADDPGPRRYRAWATASPAEIEIWARERLPMPGHAAWVRCVRRRSGRGFAAIPLPSPGVEPIAEVFISAVSAGYQRHHIGERLIRPRNGWR